MSEAIEYVTAFVSRSLVSLDHGANVFLNFLNWDIAFKLLSLGILEAFLAFVSDELHVNALTVSQVSHLLGDLTSASEGTGGNDSPVDVVAEVLLELLEVPAVHGLEAELLLEHGVDVEKTSLVVSNINNIALISGEDNSVKGGALLFESVDLLGGLREGD